jgi:pimeloyl-ACP methyl ester carboxylesterase
MNYSDISIRYWTYGNPKKPTLLLVHGITGTHRGFYKIIPYLTDDFFIITPDLPGFGESTTTRPLSIARHAEILNHFIEKLRLRHKPYIVGHSYGTLVVAQACQIAPELSQERIILISPVPSAIRTFEKRQLGKIGVELHYAIGTMGKLGKWWLRRKTIAKIITVTLLTTRHKTIRHEIHQEHLTNLSYIKRPRELYRLFREIHTTGIDTVASHITKNILVVSGTDDVSAPFEEQRKAVRKLKKGILLPVKDVGHLAHYERPRDLARAILLFFR